MLGRGSTPKQAVSGTEEEPHIITFAAIHRVFTSLTFSQKAFHFVKSLIRFELMFKLSLTTNSIPGLAVECWKGLSRPRSLSGRVNYVVPP